MDISVFPTKGNLMNAQNTLALSRQGYELLDKKRNILIREMMLLIDEANEVQSHIDETFMEAYSALQDANVMMGIRTVEQVSYAVETVEDITIRHRSVMGVDIPVVNAKEEPIAARYGMFQTGTSLDTAYEKFDKVRNLIIQLAEIETSVYRLANSIRKTQKRANALKNVMIPRYENLTKTISEVLEEKDREEFSRLKSIKNAKNKE